jgi:hypothetical protein
MRYDLEQQVRSSVVKVLVGGDLCADRWQVVGLDGIVLVANLNRNHVRHVSAPFGVLIFLSPNDYSVEFGLFAAYQRAWNLPNAGICVKHFGEHSKTLRFDANGTSDGGSLTDWRW